METYLNNINTEKVTSLLNETEKNVEYFESITNKVVLSYCNHLDELMKKIYEEVVAVDEPALVTVEKYLLELSNCMYFISPKVEELGIREALSKSAYKEVYNNSYLNNQIVGATDNKKKTVAELTALSENESIYENTVAEIYSRAYKIYKMKLDAAGTMISTLSKILSKRMTEMQLTNFTPSGKQILNETI